MNINEKLLKIQSELKAPKNQYNSFGNYHYRSCEDILEAVKPLANKYGATVLLNDEVIQLGERFYVKATAKILDTAKGEDGKCDQIQISAFAREELTKKGMDSSQLPGAQAVMHVNMLSMVCSALMIPKMRTHKITMKYPKHRQQRNQLQHETQRHQNQQFQDINVVFAMRI